MQQKISLQSFMSVRRYTGCSLGVASIDGLNKISNQEKTEKKVSCYRAKYRLESQGPVRFPPVIFLYRCRYVSAR